MVFLIQSGGTSVGETLADHYHNQMLELCYAFPVKPREHFYTRKSWRGTKEITLFIKVDEDGLETIIDSTWQRVFTKYSGPKQGPAKRLRFLTANRCDHNRGRSWDRKAA